MKTTFQLWLGGLIAMLTITVVIYGILHLILPNPISLLESWGLVMLLVISKSGVELYQKSEPLTDKNETE